MKIEGGGPCLCGNKTVRITLTHDEAALLLRALRPVNPIAKGVHAALAPLGITAPQNRSRPSPAAGGPAETPRG